jgi:hypothetical protein
MTEYLIVDGIREADALRLGLQREYPPLARLPDQAMRALGRPTPAYAFGWGADLYRHTGYWGEVAVPYRDDYRGLRQPVGEGPHLGSHLR